MEQEIKKKGIVTTVAESTGGIKLDNKIEWYGAVGKSREYVKADLKGKLVEISMNEKLPGKFSFIKVLSDKVVEQTVDTPGYDNMLSFDNKDERISRHGAFNTAVNVLGACEEDTTQGIATYLLKAIGIADLVLRYVNKDKNLTAYLIEKVNVVEEEDVL